MPAPRFNRTEAGLARDLAYALDPPLWAQSELKLELDPWQQQVLRARRPVLLLAARQSGKTTTAAVFAAHAALYGQEGEGEVLLVSPTERQSKNILKRARRFLEAAGATIRATSDSRIRLANDAEILALPGDGDTVRGFTPRAIVVDEAVFADEELYAAVLPMRIVSRAPILMCSSAGPARGLFYEAWTDPSSDADWLKVRVSTDMVPRLTPEALEGERRRMGELKYRTEFGLEFLESGVLPISLAAAREAITDEVEALDLDFLGAA